MRDTAWSALAAIVMSAGRLVLAAILARKLGPTHFGEFVFTQWVIDIVFVLGSFGLTGVATRFFAQYRFEGAAIYKAFGRWYATRALFVVVAAATMTPLVVYFSSSGADLAIVAVWAVGNAIWAVTMARLQGMQHFKLVAVSNFLYVAVAGVGVLSIPEKWGIDAVMAVLATATLGAAFVCGFGRRVVVDTARGRESSTFPTLAISRYAINVWMSSAIGALVWSRAEISVVRAVLSPADVAFYGAALSLAGLANLGMSLLTGALGPRLAELWGQEKAEEAWALSRTVTDYLILTSAIGIGFVITFASEMLLVVFGGDYESARVPLLFLVVGAFGLTSGCVNTLVQYETQGAFAKNVNLVGALLLFALAIPLVSSVGIVGAAVARAGVQLAIAYGTFLYCSSKLSSRSFSWNNLTWALVLIVALMAAVFTLDTVLGRALAYAGFSAALIYQLKMGPENVDLNTWFTKILLPRLKRRKTS
jgi:O-antigen/teichoic acid export membrane protein